MSEHEWFVGCRTCDAEPDVSGHFVNFTEYGWSVEHSLQCRMDGEMQRGCAYERSIREIEDTADDGYGRYRITDIDSEGLPSLEYDDPLAPQSQAKGDGNENAK